MLREPEIISVDDFHPTQDPEHAKKVMPADVHAHQDAPSGKASEGEHLLGATPDQLGKLDSLDPTQASDG